MHRFFALLTVMLPLLAGAGETGWPVYGHDQGAARFSPLTQINTDNVDELELAWSYRHGDLERFPDRASYAGLRNRVKNYLAL